MVSPSQSQVPVGIPIVYRFAQVDGKLTPQAPGDVLLQPLLQGDAISRATSSLPPQAPDAVAECLADFAPGRPPCVSADFLAGEAALAKAFLESRRASLDRYGLGGDPRLVEITRDHPRSPEITRDDSLEPRLTAARLRKAGREVGKRRAPEERKTLGRRRPRERRPRRLRRADARRLQL